MKKYIIIIAVMACFFNINTMQASMRDYFNFLYNRNNHSLIEWSNNNPHLDIVFHESKLYRKTEKGTLIRFQCQLWPASRFLIVSLYECIINNQPEEEKYIYLDQIKNFFNPENNLQSFEVILVYNGQISTGFTSDINEGFTLKSIKKQSHC